MTLDPAKFTSRPYDVTRDSVLVEHPDAPGQVWVIDHAHLVGCDDDWIVALREMQRRARAKRGGNLPGKFPATALQLNWRPIV
jgi:hypothetical protein